MIISTLHIQYVNQYSVSITPDYKHLCSTPDYQVPINLSVIHTQSILPVLTDTDHVLCCAVYQQRTGWYAIAAATAAAALNASVTITNKRKEHNVIRQHYCQVLQLAATSCYCSGQHHLHILAHSKPIVALHCCHNTAVNSLHVWFMYSIRCFYNCNVTATDSRLQLSVACV